jgi:hypothetical protein
MLKEASSMSHNNQRLHMRQLATQDCSPEEQEVYHRAIVEGAYWALIDYPLLITHEETLFDLASTFCQETDDRKRTIFLSNWASGYVAIGLQPKDKVEALALDAKSLPREQVLLSLLSHRSH